MNRLQICQRILREATGASMSNTVDQVGMVKKIVEFSDAAYEDIQNRHKVWEFLREEFSFETIASTANYTKTSVSLNELASWKVDSFRAYLDTVNDEQWIDYYDWNFFRDSRLIGANRTVEGRPTEFSVKPNRSVQLWPVPDDAYTIVGEYYKRAQTMTANADEPNFPQQFHMAIVWRGLMYFAADQEVPGVYQHAEKEFKKVFFALENDQLPEAEEPDTLA